jgi:hypothetical protein
MLMKKSSKLSPEETRTLLLKNSKKLMSKKYRTEIPELMGEKKNTKQ